MLEQEFEELPANVKMTVTLDVEEKIKKEKEKDINESQLLTEVDE